MYKWYEPADEAATARVVERLGSPTYSKQEVKKSVKQVRRRIEFLESARAALEEANIIPATQFMIMVEHNVDENYNTTCHIIDELLTVSNNELQALLRLPV